MNEKLKAALAKLQASLGEQKTLLAIEAPSADESARIVALDAELDTLEADVTEAKAGVEREAKAAQRTSWLNEAVTALPVGEPTAPGSEVKSYPAHVLRGRAKHFMKGGRSAAESNQKAYDFGMWALGGVFKNAGAQQYCRQHGIELKDQSEGVLTGGGALVPPDFENELIDLREMFGVARRLCNVRTMSTDTREVPRRTGGLTAYAIGEAQAITESDKSWDLVELVARKWATLTYISSELNEDAIIDLGNDLAGEIAYAFSAVEDDCLFNGDGTSTYHGITGIRTALKGLSGTIANIAGLVVGAGNAYSELLLTDFEAVVGLLPQYADTSNARWVVHRSFFWNVMVKLMLAAGGVTEAEISNQGRNIPFLGYPVEVAQKMPHVEANSQVAALFGDFSKGVLFGDRRRTTIALSEHTQFANDQIAIRGTERFDINVHDVGNASSSAGSRVPGPIVGLITANS